MIIKKIIRTESNLYALGKLRTDFIKNTSNNSKIFESQQLCLYKLLIDETIKNKSQIEHQLLASNLNLNDEKMLIEIDSEVEFHKSNPKCDYFIL